MSMTQAQLGGTVQVLPAGWAGRPGAAGARRVPTRGPRSRRRAGPRPPGRFRRWVHAPAYARPSSSSDAYLDLGFTPLGAPPYGDDDPNGMRARPYVTADQPRPALAGPARQPLYEPGYDGPPRFEGAPRGHGDVPQDELSSYPYGPQSRRLPSASPYPEDYADRAGSDGRTGSRPGRPEPARPRAAISAPPRPGDRSSGPIPQLGTGPGTGPMPRPDTGPARRSQPRHVRTRSDAACGYGSHAARGLGSDAAGDSGHAAARHGSDAPRGYRPDARRGPEHWPVRPMPRPDTGPMPRPDTGPMAAGHRADAASAGSDAACRCHGSVPRAGTGPDAAGGGTSRGRTGPTPRPDAAGRSRRYRSDAAPGTGPMPRPGADAAAGRAPVPAPMPRAGPRPAVAPPGHRPVPARTRDRVRHRRAPPVQAPPASRCRPGHRAAHRPAAQGGDPPVTPGQVH